MRCSGFPEEDYAFFVLGTLPDQDAGGIGQHLSDGCETCLEEVNRARGLWLSVAVSAPPAEPSPALRERLLASLSKPENQE